MDFGGMGTCVKGAGTRTGAPASSLISEKQGYGRPGGFRVGVRAGPGPGTHFRSIVPAISKTSPYTSKSAMKWPSYA